MYLLASCELWFKEKKNYIFKLGDNQNDSFEAAPKYVKHISKSASELSNRDEKKVTPQETPTASPRRARGAINPAVSGVLQRTHGFFSTLKVKHGHLSAMEVCRN